MKLQPGGRAECTGAIAQPGSARRRILGFWSNSAVIVGDLAEIFADLAAIRPFALVFQPR